MINLNTQVNDSLPVRLSESAAAAARLSPVTQAVSVEVRHRDRSGTSSSLRLDGAYLRLGDRTLPRWMMRGTSTSRTSDSESMTETGKLTHMTGLSF